MKINKFKKSFFVLVFSFLGFSTALLCLSCEKKKQAVPVRKAASQPNVVLIVIDTLRADHLSSYGYGIETTPNIDALAEDAIVFQQAYTTAPWTQPAIASIMTGQYPWLLGCRGYPIKVDDRWVMLPELFKKKGYFTGGIVSHSFLTDKYNFPQGFDWYHDKEIAYGSATKILSYVSSPGISKAAVGFLQKNAKKPFFLFLHYFDPHYSYVMHPILNNYPDYEGILSSRLDIISLRRLFTSKGGPRDLRFIAALYDSEVRFVDKYVGDVMKKLKALGVYDNTIVVLTADHGEELGERNEKWIGHTKNLTQEALRVPLLIKLPKSASRKIVTNSISTQDIMPTLIDLVGLSLPKGYQLSGKAINLNRPEAHDKLVVAETFRVATRRAVINGRWKMQYDIRANRKLLFDQLADPHNEIDVAPLYPEITNDMFAELKRWGQRLLVMKTQFADASQGKAAKISDAEKKRLEALGYMEPGKGKPADKPASKAVKAPEPSPHPKELPKPKP